jgi:hypothetical protein
MEKQQQFKLDFSLFKPSFMSPTLQKLKILVTKVVLQKLGFVRLVTGSGLED